MAELVQAGLVLTLVGMTVVYVLLGALVGVTELLGWFCRLFPSAPPPAATAGDVVPAGVDEEEAEIAGVIAAAIRMFRRDRPPSSSAQPG